jgi:hypothetical protein
MAWVCPYFPLLVRKKGYKGGSLTKNERLIKNVFKYKVRSGPLS